MNKFETMARKNGVTKQAQGQSGLSAKVAQIAADIDYLAMMCDIDLESEENDHDEV